MAEDTQNLFPVKELFDMKFLELVKYDKAEVKENGDIDKALQEYFFLTEKGKEVQKLYMKHSDDLVNRALKLRASIDYVRQIIFDKIHDSFDCSEVIFEEDENGVSKATFPFEHGEIVIIEKSKTEFKIKPVKEK